jgi:MFS family permease
VPRGAGRDPFCKYDDPMISLFVSVLFLAGIPGAFLGSWTNNWYGRRPTMMIGGGNFLVGAILMSSATHIAMLVIGRIFLGVGIGICVQCGPLFLSELAPAHLRGLFNTQFQARARGRGVGTTAWHSRAAPGCVAGACAGETAGLAFRICAALPIPSPIPTSAYCPAPVPRAL